MRRGGTGPLVLVTRPEPDAAHLVARLAALGHPSIVDPLLAAEYFALEPETAAGADAVVVTSRNALRALAGSPVLGQLSRLPLFAVGAATAGLARELGFMHVVTGTGGAAELAPLVVERIGAWRRGADAPQVLYLAGEALAFDMGSALTQSGLSVRQATVYRMVAAKSLRPETGTALARGEIGAVLLLSPRTAETYVRLIEKAGLVAGAAAVRHICLSGAVASVLAPLAPERMATAVHPSIEELLALLAP